MAVLAHDHQSTGHPHVQAHKPLSSGQARRCARGRLKAVARGHIPQ